MAEATMDAAGGPPPYPVQYSVEYPESSSRLKTLFRLILILPIAAIYYFVYQISGILFLPLVLMLLFRKKYPRWWFDVNLALTKFEARVGVYFALLRDEYPSTDEEQAVQLDIEYPDAQNDLNRFLPLIKWLLALPHWVIIVVLSFVFLVVTIIAWFAILITGKYPRPLFDFVVGYGRWVYRTVAYAFLLATDRYPPFRFGP